MIRDAQLGIGNNSAEEGKVFVLSPLRKREGDGRGAGTEPGVCGHSIIKRAHKSGNAMASGSSGVELASCAGVE